MPQLIHVPSIATESDDDDTVGGNAMASDFCDRIDHPVVDDVRMSGSSCSTIRPFDRGLSCNVPVALRCLVGLSW